MGRINIVDNSVCASIITYNPSKSRLEENIISLFKNGIDKIIIIDNNSKNVKDIIALIKKLEIRKFIVVLNIQNKGVAFALNQALNIANKHGYKWLLTLDQDSVCSSNYILEMSIHLNNQNVGLIYPENIQDDKRHKIVNSRKTIVQKIIDTYIKKEKKLILQMPITSGSLINIEASLNCGGFTNYLFIDSVDFDFNLKLYENKYKIISCSKVILYHELGAPKNKYFLGYNFSCSGHPAWRYYYITRNAWLLKHNHSHNKVSKKWCNRYLIEVVSPLRLLSVFISNDFSFKYVFNIIKGNYDGIIKRIRSHNEIMK